MTDPENQTKKEDEEIFEKKENKDIGPQEVLDYPKLEPLGEVRRQEIELEDQVHLRTEKLIIECGDNPKFQNAILPQNPEKVNAQVLENALETILTTDTTDISRLQRLELFKDALDYYANPTEVKAPLWHSTSSYVLRKSLEEGFIGGHGKYAGEASVKIEEGKETQKGLSVSHPNYTCAESFQQMFARLSSKKADINNFLSVDSEKVTGKPLAEIFVKEIIESLSPEEIRELVARRLNIKISEVTKEQIAQMTSSTTQEAFIKEFTEREYMFRADKVKAEVLPGISNTELRKKLENEVDHPFPCFITFEGTGKEQNLNQLEKNWSIPFEDRYWDTLEGRDIREIRVPQGQIEKVQGWLEQKGLNGVKIVPIEVYEIKRIIQDKTL
ncbi:MAG: hypothetical protein WC806_04900 [Candidatus Gracilibacteria bacterium]|jgi:hypothetical protein